MRERIRFANVVLAAGLCANIGGLAPFPVAAQTVVFFVDATFSDRIVSGFPHTGWQNTGIAVEAGDRVIMTATGTACRVAPDGGCTGPDGESFLAPDSSFLAQGLPMGSLVGKIGSGNAFFIGSAFDQIVAETGILYLGYNDSRCDDNTGGFNVEIGFVIPVTIDIKPGEFPNSINPNSQGVIPVAILTTTAMDNTAAFDATAVDPTTVHFGRTGTEAAPVQDALEDVDGDGDIDMILHFNTQDTGIQCGHTSATLTGQIFDGQTIHGTDSIETVGCK